MMSRLRRIVPLGLTAALLVAAAAALPAQAVRVASLNMSRAGQPGSSWLELARTVARFDVVAADGVRGGDDMEKVLAGLGDGWEAVLSGDGSSFGFFYNERLRVVKELGAWRGPGALFRASYGVRFQLSRSPLAFTFVACRVSTQDIRRLPEIEQYFETLTAHHNSTVLAARLEGARSEETRIFASPGVRFPAGAHPEGRRSTAAGVRHHDCFPIERAARGAGRLPALAAYRRWPLTGAAAYRRWPLTLPPGYYPSDGGEHCWKSSGTCSSAPSRATWPALARSGWPSWSGKS